MNLFFVNSLYESQATWTMGSASYGGSGMGEYLITARQIKDRNANQDIL